LWHRVDAGASAAFDDFAKVSRIDARPRRRVLARRTQISTGGFMKGLNQQKSDKKKPAKSLKEKRAEKQQKKASKGR
jgi:hypothetical protein